MEFECFSDLSTAVDQADFRIFTAARKREDDANNIRLRSALERDAEMIACIYNCYIQNTVITFEEELVSAPTMAARLAEIQNASLPWLVAN